MSRSVEVIINPCISGSHRRLFCSLLQLIQLLQCKSENLAYSIASIIRQYMTSLVFLQALLFILLLKTQQANLLSLYRTVAKTEKRVISELLSNERAAIECLKKITARVTRQLTCLAPLLLTQIREKRAVGNPYVLDIPGSVIINGN